MDAAGGTLAPTDTALLQILRERLSDRAPIKAKIEARLPKAAAADENADEKGLTYQQHRGRFEAQSPPRQTATAPMHMD